MHNISLLKTDQKEFLENNSGSLKLTKLHLKRSIFGHNLTNFDPKKEKKNDLLL